MLTSKLHDSFSSYATFFLDKNPSTPLRRNKILRLRSGCQGQKNGTPGFRYARRGRRPFSQAPDCYRDHGTGMQRV